MSASTLSPPPVLMLMGPTASGKTDLAMQLCKTLPVDIISVDSALVYKTMDIGTAKPSLAEQQETPHQLIDICDPADSYSAADFCRDANCAIVKSIENQRIPLLVGGTMMYFKALLDGLAEMPPADANVRAAIATEADAQGWPAMHEQLQSIDPDYAAQLHPNHSQRIARALEVYRISGTTMTAFRQRQLASTEAPFTERYRVLQFGLIPENRALLHRRIKDRFLIMLERGFVDEVKTLRARGDLHLDLPSMRAVGYRQVWQYLENEFDHSTMVEKAIAATRQLAKRQLTWLRNWSDLHRLSIDTGNIHTLDQKISELM